jgi:hypothetical protein
MMKKKLWNTPTLVVLLRGTREEAVLTFCKFTVATGEWGGPEEQPCTTPEFLECYEIGAT